MNKINREGPAELDVHVVLDNLSTHKAPQVRRGLEREPEPFVWHKTADEILERLGHYCADVTNTEFVDGPA